MEDIRVKVNNELKIKYKKSNKTNKRNKIVKTIFSYNFLLFKLNGY